MVFHSTQLPQRVRIISSSVCALLLFPLLHAILFGQPVQDESGTLFFPPKLTVHAFSDDSPKPHRAWDNAPPKTTNPTIAVRKRLKPDVIAILPMVFFEGAGSITIPERYQIFYSSGQTASYTDADDVQEVIEATNKQEKYYEILNIIGFRMKKFPASRIKLEGSYSTLPGENAEVGLTRAHVVQEYLNTIWQIAPERIEVLPPRQICDSADNIARQAEAQRVTIMASDWELVEPVHYNWIRTEEVFLHFHFTIDPFIAPEEVSAVELVINSGDQLLTSAEIAGHSDSTSYSLYGVWPAFWLNTESSQALTVRAIIRTQNGNIRNAAPVTIPITVSSTGTSPERQPFFTSRFALPFFEWRDSSLSTLQQQYLETFLDSVLLRKTHRGKSLTVNVRGLAEEGEQTQVDITTLQIRKRMVSFQSRTFARLYSPRQKLPILFYTPGERIKKEFFAETWLGENFWEEAHSMRDFTPMVNREPVENSVSDREWLDTLALGRGMSVSRYLQQSKVGDALEDVIVENTRGLQDILPEPEDRYYLRFVSIHVMNKTDDDGFKYLDPEERIERQATEAAP